MSTFIRELKHSDEKLLLETLYATLWLNCFFKLMLRQLWLYKFIPMKSTVTAIVANDNSKKDFGCGGITAVHYGCSG